MADEKAKNSGTSAGSPVSSIPELSKPEAGRLAKLKGTMSEPSKLRSWYFDYVLSEFMFVSVYVAVLLTIKVYFEIDWVRFFNGLTLFYVIFAGITTAKISRTVCNYFDKKAKLMELVAKSNDLRNVRL